MKINKALLTYIGIKPGKSIPPSEQFSVEITAEELTRIKTFPFPQCFTGKVVSANVRSKKVVGEVQPNFCNPFNDFYCYHNAGWKIETCICEGDFHNEHCAFYVPGFPNQSC